MVRKNVIVFALMSALAGAGDAWAASGDDDGWRFGLAVPYIWATGITGKTVVDGDRTDIEIDFSDILSNTDAGFTGYFEVGRGRWSAWFDYQYLDLRPEIESGLLPVELRFRVNVSELAASYRFSRRWSVYAGGRVNDIEATIDIGNLPTLEHRESTTDFFGGLRFTAPINDRWSTSLRGDVGTGDSDLVWSAMGFFNVSFTDLVGASLGLRYLGTNSEIGDGAERVETDIVAGGPLVGLTFSW